MTTALIADDEPPLVRALQTQLLQRLLPAALGPGPLPGAMPPERLRWARAGSAEHLIRTPVAELAAQLDPLLFVQIHRSTLINLAHLAGTRRDDTSRLFVRLRGHAGELPVSRAYVHLFKAM